MNQNWNQTPPVDPLADTQPTRIAENLAHYQPIKVEKIPQEKKRKPLGCGCLIPIVLVLGIILVYLLAPLRTNILILGIDRTPDGSAVGRSDTNILVSVIPLKPTVNMLSIPRDLWVSIPDAGENRINTAHFFAEANQAGSGPYAAMQTVRQNFGLTLRYFVRVRFDGFTNIVDAMGGIKVNLPNDMAGYSAGSHTLNGQEALAFARNRSGTDDFYRMAQGQLLLKSAMQQMLNPLSWPRIPAVMQAVMQSVDTNLPIWHWPRIGFALLRAGPGGIDNRTLTREMVTPWTTDGGANVLLPNWDAINPVLMEMFGE